MPRIPSPGNPRNDEARKQLQSKAKKMNPRKFRDAVTRASGAIGGVTTTGKQWNRWSA